MIPSMSTERYNTKIHTEPTSSKVLTHEKSVDIESGQLLCMHGIYFRILNLTPIVFNEECQIEIRARFEGIR